MGKLTIKIAIVLAWVFLSTGCDRDRNETGWDYFPDMFYSYAYESWQPNPNFEDGKTMRTPVEGTISRDIIPFRYTLDPGERERAGVELVNPVPFDAEALARGEKEYQVFCMDCHGSKGEGDGFLYSSGLYVAKPRSLVNDIARSLKDGEIFHSITLGFGSMGEHGSLIRQEDRWKIVHYIREDLQQNVAQDTIAPDTIVTEGLNALVPDSTESNNDL